MKQSRIVKEGASAVLMQEYNDNSLLNKNTQWLPATTGAVFGVALNHKVLREEMVEQFNSKPHVKPPTTPVLHIKTNNTHSGYGAAIPVPASGDAIYAGPALGVVISKEAHHVSAENAQEYIQGYTIVNEVSLAEESFYRPAIKAKCRDGFCPIGPSIIDAKHITTPESLTIETYINGELKHSTNTDQLHYSIAQLIEFISSFITLQAGDLIITATPPRTVELNAGDTVAIHIEGLGSLENPIVAEQELAQ